jgi:hypothetical protein
MFFDVKQKRWRLQIWVRRGLRLVCSSLQAQTVCFAVLLAAVLRVRHPAELLRLLQPCHCRAWLRALTASNTWWMAAG